MKILWLSGYPHPNRKNKHAGSWITSLADELTDKTNIQLTILHYNREQKEEIQRFRLKENLELCYLKVPSYYINMLFLNYLYIFLLRKAIKKYFFNVDLIHVHGTEYQFHVVAQNLNKPYVVSIQGLIYKYIRYINKRISFGLLSWVLAMFHEKKYMQRIPYYSCRTHWDVEAVKELNVKARIFMIWEMMRKEFYSYAYNPSSQDILYVGGNNEIKGFKYILQAFNLVCQQLPVKLVICGNCKLDQVEMILKRYNLSNINVNKDIVLLGYLNPARMCQQYRNTMCLIHPSLIDNSPNSVCEAQLAGIPVIASDVGGVSSLIENGQTGFLVKLSSDKIAEQILHLYNNPDVRQMISINAYHMARQRHDKSVIINNTMNMYYYIIENMK